MSALSYDVRIFAVSKYSGTRKTTYRLRWRVGAKTFSRTFAITKLADHFRAQLITAARDGTAFSLATGQPPDAKRGDDSILTWFEFATIYARSKWPTASPRHRKGIAEALTALTVALLTEEVRPREATLVRRALNRWAFNEVSRNSPPPAEFAKVLAWVQRASQPLSALTDPVVVRLASDALARTLKGELAAPATVIRKRATLNNALEYAVELGHLPANPLRSVKLRIVRSDDAVDRRVVLNPRQAATLLAAVREDEPALEGFFACLYYAGMRPAEARNLRSTDCYLPEEGWGRAVLTGSHQYAGAAWTNSGVTDEERSLKHRTEKSTRPIPLHPALVATLRRHLDQFGTGASSRLFVTRTGRAGVPISPPYDRPVSMNAVYRVWNRARTAALTPDQASSALGRRPYDLRHACLSTWLNAGVSPAQVAAWAGHGVDVLLKVYAKCLDGEEAAALRRIDIALEDE